MTSTKERLGRGWNAPILPQSVGAEGKSALLYVDGPEKVRQSMLIILDTEPGERVMRPTFGCGLRRYLMKPNTTATRALMQRDVVNALTAWEPRISLTGVTVDPGDVSGDDAAMVLIQIAYIHVRTGRKDNLVYPFYLQG